MSKSLRGELTEQTQTAFEHPLGHLSERITNLTALGYAISSANADHVQRLLGGQSEWMLSEGGYSGNTPLVRSHIFHVLLQCTLQDWAYLDRSAHCSYEPINRRPPGPPAQGSVRTPT